MVEAVEQVAAPEIPPAAIPENNPVLIGLLDQEREYAEGIAQCRRGAERLRSLDATFAAAGKEMISAIAADSVIVADAVHQGTGKLDRYSELIEQNGFYAIDWS